PPPSPPHFPYTTLFRSIQREERAGRLLDERLLGRVERDVAREPDRPGDQLLAGTRGPGDQGRDVAHPGVEPAAVAPGVVGEDRLDRKSTRLNSSHDQIS